MGGFGVGVVLGLSDCVWDRNVLHELCGHSLCTVTRGKSDEKSFYYCFKAI